MASLTNQVDSLLKQLSSKTAVSDASVHDGSMSVSVSDIVSGSVNATSAATSVSSEPKNNPFKVCALALSSMIAVLVIFVCVRRYFEVNNKVQSIFSKMKKKKNDTEKEEMVDPNFTVLNWDVIFSR